MHASRPAVSRCETLRHDGNGLVLIWRTRRPSGRVVHVDESTNTQATRWRFRALCQLHARWRKRDNGSHTQWVVAKRRWISEEQFALSFALGRLTPGTNVLAFCVGVGWMLRRWSGAIATLLASSIPCTLFVVVITMLFAQWQENAFAQAAIKGTVAAAVAVTVKTVWTIAHPYFKTGKRLRVILIGASAFLLNVVLGISPIYVLVIAAVVGCFLP